MHPDWTIKALWVGDSLSVIEQLSLASFVHHGHRVELFTYEPVADIPVGVVVRDGNEILGKDRIFMYRSRPSYGAFANWFRYVLLYREGGVWIDTDVVCLKPFDFSAELFFGWEQYNKVNNAVVGSHPGMEVFAFLARQAEQPNVFLPYDTGSDKCRKLMRRYLHGNHRSDLEWGETGPVGFTRALRHFGYLDYALSTTAFYPVHPTCWNTVFNATYPDAGRSFPDSYAIHLWNEMMRREPGFDKSMTYPENSLIEDLKRRYLGSGEITLADFNQPGSDSGLPTPAGAGPAAVAADQKRPPRKRKSPAVERGFFRQISLDSAVGTPASCKPEQTQG